MFILGQQACTALASVIQSTRLQINLTFSSQLLQEFKNVSFSYNDYNNVNIFFQGYIVLQNTFAKYLNKKHKNTECICLNHKFRCLQFWKQHLNSMPCSWQDIGWIPLPFQSKYNLFLLCFIILQTWCKANTWHFSLIKTISWTHNWKYYFHYRGLEEDVFQCSVQLCGFPSLDLVQEGDLIGRQEWTHWDAERPRELPVGGAYAFSSSGSDTESTEAKVWYWCLIIVVMFNCKCVL